MGLLRKLKFIPHRSPNELRKDRKVLIVIGIYISLMTLRAL